jgi:hypothetical protein
MKRSMYTMEPKPGSGSGPSCFATEYQSASLSPC